MNDQLIYGNKFNNWILETSNYGTKRFIVHFYGLSYSLLRKKIWRYIYSFVENLLIKFIVTVVNPIYLIIYGRDTWLVRNLREENLKNQIIEILFLRMCA